MYHLSKSLFRKFATLGLGTLCLFATARDVEAWDAPLSLAQCLEVFNTTLFSPDNRDADREVKYTRACAVWAGCAVLNSDLVNPYACGYLDLLRAAQLRDCCIHVTTTENEDERGTPYTCTNRILNSYLD